MTKSRLLINKKTILSLSLAAAAVGGTFFSSAAVAVRCDYSVECATTTTRRIDQLESSLSRVVIESTNRIIDALTAQSGALTSSEAQNTQAMGENIQKVQQAAEMSARMGEISAVSCGGASTAKGGRSGGLSNGGNGGRVIPPGSQLSDETKNAMKVGLGQTNPPPEDKEITQINIAKGHCKDFNDPSSAMGKMCAALGVTSQGNNPYPSADVDARTLFNGPESIKKSKSIASVPSSGPEADARQAQLNLLFEGTPVEIPLPNEMAKSVFAAPFTGAYREYRAAKDLASHSAREYTRLTQVDPQTKIAFEEIRKNYPQFVQNYMQGVSSTAYENGLSPLALLELQVEGRVGNETWMEEMSQAEDKEREKEMVMMQALNLRIQNRLYVTQLQTNVLLSKLLDLQVEQTLRPRLEDLGARTTVSTQQARPPRGSTQPAASNAGVTP